MKALILAGGLGTRLRTLVPDRPKPMAQTDGKPFLQYQIEWLLTQGVHEIVLCVGHMAETIQRHFGDGNQWGVRINYSIESQPLGTAGAIKHAEKFIDSTFITMNGDTFLNISLEDVVNKHKHLQAVKPDTAGTLTTLQVPDCKSFGVLEIDEHHEILAFREKTETGPCWINGGLYILEPHILELIPPGENVSIEKDTFPLILNQGHRLFAYPFQGFFVDIGTPQGYQRFQQHLEERRS